MQPKWQGGHLMPAPMKTSLKAILNKIFNITWNGGSKIPFCILLASPAETCVLYQKIEKVIKTTQNVLKTVDNHW